MAFLDLVHSPPIETELPGLLSHWRHCDVTVWIDFPDNMEWGYWIGNAVRGMMGHQLAALQTDKAARARRPDPHQRPGCYDMLYKPVGTYLGRTQIPKPFTIFCDRIKNRIKITIRLFGIAEIIAKDISLALQHGLAQGMSLRAKGGLRVPCTPYDVTIVSTRSLPNLQTRAADIDMFTLRFLTPLMRKRGSNFRANTDGVLQAIYERVMGLALWNGIKLPPTPSCFDKHKTPFEIFDADVRIERWDRYSSRQPGKPIPMAGLIGDVKVTGYDDNLAILLGLGERCCAGSGTSQGLGRYDLINGI